MGVYLISGPHTRKGQRKYVIAEVNGKRRRINYAKYLVLKDGVEVGKFEQIHHLDGNSKHDVRENLKVEKEYKHNKLHRRKK